MSESVPDQTENANQPTWLGIGVVAQRFGVSVETIRRWAKAGILTEHRPDGSSRVFDAKQVAEVLRQKPLTARAAAQYLGISLPQLKQAEDAGLLASAGNTDTIRIFTTNALNAAREKVAKFFHTSDSNHNVLKQPTRRSLPAVASGEGWVPPDNFPPSSFTRHSSKSGGGPASSQQNGMARLILLVSALALLLLVITRTSNLATALTVTLIATLITLTALKHYLPQSHSLSTLLFPGPSATFAQSAPKGTSGEVLISYHSYQTLHTRLKTATIIITLSLASILLGLKVLPVISAALLIPVLVVAGAAGLFAFYSIITLAPRGERVNALKALVRTDPRIAFARYAPTENTGALKVGYTTYKKLYKAASLSLITLILLVALGLGREIYLARMSADQNFRAASDQFQAVLNTLKTGQGNLAEELSKLAAQSLQTAPGIDQSSLTQAIIDQVTANLPDPPTEIVKETATQTIVERTIVETQTAQSIQLEGSGQYVVKDNRGVTIFAFGPNNEVTLEESSLFNIAGAWNIHGIRVTTEANDLNDLPTLLNDTRFLVTQGNDTLDQERILTAGSGITLTDSGANNAFTISSNPATLTLTTGTTDTDATPGSVFFAGAGGVIQQDNANFFYDDTNNRVGIGTASPSVKFEVNGAHVAGKGLLLAKGVSDHGYIVVDTDSSATREAGFSWQYNSGGKWWAYIGVGSTDLQFESFSGGKVMILTQAGNVGIGETVPGAKLQINTVAAATKGLIVKAAASQSANLQEWQDSSGVAGARITAAMEFSNPTTGFALTEKFGAGAVTAGADATAFGASANAATAQSSAFGRSAAATGTQSTAIGMGSAASNTQSVALGYGASAGGSSAFAVGTSANASGTRSTAIGGQTLATATDAVAIGTFGSSTHNFSITLGNGATSTAASQFIVGADGKPISDIYIGNGVTNAAPQNIVYNATGGSGTDIAGANFTIASGKGTGNAAGGDILFQTSDAGASSATLQSLTTKMTITELGNVGIGTTTPEAQLQVNTSSASKVGLIITGAASQSANLFEVNSSGGGGGDLLNIGPSGTIQLSGGISNPLYSISGGGGVTTLNLESDTDAGYATIQVSSDQGQFSLRQYDSANPAQEFGVTVTSDSVLLSTGDLVMGSNQSNVLLASGNTVTMVLDANQNVGLNTTSFGTDCAKCLAIAGSTAPSASITDGIQLFAVDIAGSHELRVRDEAGNVTTLSPHNFGLFEPEQDYYLPWSYTSERDHHAINVDMYGAIQQIELISGKHFIYGKNLESGETFMPTNLAEILSVPAAFAELDVRLAAIQSEVEQGKVKYSEVESRLTAVETTPHPTPLPVQGEGDDASLLPSQGEGEDEGSTSSDLDLNSLIIRTDVTVYDTLLTDTLEIATALNLHGDATIWGKLLVKSDVEIVGNAKVAGTLTVSSEQAGSVTVPQNATAITVTFKKPFSVSPHVLVSPEGILVNYTISQKSAEGFTIQLSEPSREQFVFSWFALPIEGEDASKVEITTQEPAATDEEPTAPAEEEPQPSPSLEPTPSPSPEVPTLPQL